MTATDTTTAAAPTEQGPRRTTVLVAGAGPTGLMLAHRLVRHGVDVTVIDKHAAPLEWTKAAALHARTLEIFADAGVIDRVLAEGQQVDHLTLRTKDADRLSVDFSVLGETAYPYMVDLEQNRSEHVLIDALAERGTHVLREHELTGFTDDGRLVHATVRGPDGQEQHWQADYLVGADGQSSVVREMTDLGFEGAAYADPWVLCDAQLDWPLPRNEMTFSADPEGIYGVFPLPEGRFRVAYTQNLAADGTPVDPDIADVQAAMARTGLAGTVRSIGQISTFSLAHREAPRWRAGRVFLAGDAAHVHTPFGGQGMNLGLADATNLAWKLALVATGAAPATLLDSYEEERRAIGHQVVTFTHLGAGAMLLRASRLTYLRDAAMTAMQAARPARTLMAGRLSQLSHSYRGTTAVGGRAGGLRGGDRLPDPQVYDATTGTYRRVHEMVDPMRMTLVLTATTEAGLHQAARTAHDIGARWGDRVAVRVLTTRHDAADHLDENTEVIIDRAGHAGLYGQRARAILVRPDTHLAFTGALPTGAGALEEHLRLYATTPAATLPTARRAQPSAVAA